MKTLNPYLFTFAILLASLQLKAQSYPAALGAKFDGYENGVSLKLFTRGGSAFEGVLGFRSHGYVFTALSEKYFTAFQVSNLSFYYGAGGHIGKVGQGAYLSLSGNNQNYDNNQLLLGADGVIGFEYLFPRQSIALSIDLNPRVEITGGAFVDVMPGLGVKYTF